MKQNNLNKVTVANIGQEKMCHLSSILALCEELVIPKRLSNQK